MTKKEFTVPEVVVAFVFLILFVFGANLMLDSVKKKTKCHTDNVVYEQHGDYWQKTGIPCVKEMK